MAVKCHHCYVKVTSSCHVTSQHIQELLGAIFQTKNVVFNGEQEKESIICVRREKSIPRDHHLS